MTTNFDFSPLWPPLYILKSHPKARRVKLKVSIQKGLEIVVPPQYNVNKLSEVLERNKIWIEAQFNKIRERDDLLSTRSLPEKIHLAAINQNWTVTYLKTHSQRVKLITSSENELVIAGNIENKIACKKILKTWVKKHAQRYLLERLHAVSEWLKLPFNYGRVRSQRSMWGRCTSRKIITLNYKLIFLPPTLVTHLIIHELCHTVHLDHSAHFWRLVSSFDIDWKQHNHELRHADKTIPLWVL